MKLWTTPLSEQALGPRADLHCTPVRGFGQAVEILHGEADLGLDLDLGGEELRPQVQELRRIYEPFLASRVLPQSGTCLDIGAGAGWFALPFAAAFPRWRVLCLEADMARYQALVATIARSGLDNISCFHGGFHPAASPVDLPENISNQSLNWKETGIFPPKALQRALAQAAPTQFSSLPGLEGRLAPAQVTLGGQEQSSPGFDPALLTALAPDLVKLEAPGVEQELATALAGAPTGFVTGRLFSHLPSAALRPEDPACARQIYLPYGDHALRRDYEDGLEGRRAGLDVVVALYNGRDFIAECLDTLLAEETPDIRVLVVDDGSSDGSGDLVAERYGAHPRLTLLRKPNGGCASARNYGRAHSTASHITFVDADDRVDPALFSQLLELANYSGFNIVEGEFLLFESSAGDAGDAGDPEMRQPSYEAARFASGPSHRLGEIPYCLRPSLEMMKGQPTIWRRIYRRDFLDHWDISFPEHVRAFDDQIFQLLCAQHGGEMAHVFGVSYHYRQHSAQDIKQGDSRHFYSFNMYREVFLRAEREAWPDILPVVESLLNTMSWSYAGLHQDLKETYQQAAVAFLVMLAKGFGPWLLEAVSLERVGIEGLEFLVAQQLQGCARLPVDHGMLHLEDWRWQPEFIEMQRAPH
ncbi:glycosyltransferase [Pseudophaeobacter sp.]|uniref:glycosyltransferase n=1 Tax=Pseudophaeobacter sp. TaxID=1971739 RepID=UPI0032987957